jgi:hypothetical protein
MKGQKTGGRRVGSLNKISTEVKAILHEVVESEISILHENLNQLSPKERIDVLIKIMPYIVPKITNEPIEGVTKNLPEWMK